MKKIVIWSSNTNSSIHEATENGALYPCLVPDDTNINTVQVLLSTVGNCFNGEQSTFRFEWERVPERYALVSYLETCIDQVMPRLGVIELYCDRTKHDLNDNDYLQFARRMSNNRKGDVSVVNANGVKTYHYSQSGNGNDTIIEIKRVKDVSFEVGEGIIAFNSNF